MNFSQHKTHPVWLLGHCSIRRQKAICSFDRQCSDTDIKCSILVLHNSIRIWYNNLHNIRAHCTNTAIQFCNISGRHPTNQLQQHTALEEQKWLECLLDNSLTNQLVVSQIADWPTCALVNSPTAIFLIMIRLHYICTPNLTLTLSLSTIETV